MLALTTVHLITAPVAKTIDVATILKVYYYMVEKAGMLVMLLEFIQHMQVMLVRQTVKHI